MSINLKMPEIKELRPKITVFGVGGAGGNAVNNMIRSGLLGCEFVVANTDSQALMSSRAERMIQMGVAVTEGLGAGSQPEVGRAAAEEAIDEIVDHLSGSHMIFVTAGMGGGTGTGAAPIIARAARDQGILTVGVVTKPFQFEGARRMKVAEAGIRELQACVDTLIVIPNQNLFRIANEKTTFADAFAMADQVLYSGVACITDLMVKEGLINLDFADVRSVMREMGKAMMGTGEASGERRAIQAAEAAIANPLLDETSMKGARGLLISITGGKDLTLFEVDEAATRIREEVDPEANIILGATFEEELEGVIRVSVVATGIDSEAREALASAEARGMRSGPCPAGCSAGGEAGSPADRPSVPLRPVAANRPAPVAEPAAAGGLPARRAACGGERCSHDSGITIAPFSQVTTTYETDDLDIEMEDGDVDRSMTSRPKPRSFRRRLKRRRSGCRGWRISRRSCSGRSRPSSLPPRSRKTAVRSASFAGSPVSVSDGARKIRSRAPPGLRPLSSSQRASAAEAAAAAAAGPGASAPPPSDYVKRPPQPRAANTETSYRPRPAELDQHGRTLPRDHRSAEDELEIPAFLRRQAN